MKALLVGVYSNDNEHCFTKFAKKCVDKQILDEFESTVKLLGPLKLCKTRIFYNLTEEFPIVSFFGLGDQDAKFSKREDLHFDRENIKKALACGISSIKNLTKKVDKIVLDDCDGNYELVGLTVGLQGYSYKDYVDLEKIKPDDFSFDLPDSSDHSLELYKRGLRLARFQNLSRLLSEMPSNLCTPTRLAEFAKELATRYEVEIIVHDREWAQKKGMNSFLAVAQGSCEDCKFIELHYKHKESENEKPVVLVGKGITFDSGGLSLKKASGMDSQRADMTGSACVLSTILGAAKLKIKGHYIGIMAVCENMPGGSSVKPGDVVIAFNGKSIQIDNTDAEGRLILADALSYADTFDPQIVIDIATLTGAAKTAIGECASAIFSTSDEYFDKLRTAAQLTGQRIWRFPLYNDYVKKTSNSILADMVNKSKDASFGGGACIAAAFLSQFTKCDNYIHMDIAPTKKISSSSNYQSRGMSGGPVLNLLNFIENLNA